MSAVVIFAGPYAAVVGGNPTQASVVGSSVVAKFGGPANAHKGLLGALLALFLTKPSSAAGTASIAITWTLPTTMADGSAIGVITDQRIYYDTVSRMGTGLAYAYSVDVGDGVSTSKTIVGLQATTYYYALTATVGGVESDLGIENFGVAA